jgi:hypothetical protein
MTTNVNIPAVLEIAEGTNEFHSSLANQICNPYGGFLKIHKVVDGTKYKISQIKFRTGGLEQFVKATEEENNPIGKQIRQLVGTSKVSPTCAVSALGTLLMCRLNVISAKFKKPIHYGLRLRSNNQLGIYLTIGVQDLESFFARGEELKQTRLAREAADVGYLVDPDAISQALGHGSAYEQ